MSPQTVSSKIQRIAEWVVQYRAEGIQGLAHLIDVPFLEEAYHRVNPKSAPGVDGVTWQSYGENLADNLADLHQRLKTMRYKAQPVKRVWLEKDDGKKRPIGMRALEDKIAERAVVMVLEPIYESLFYDFSYGFRPGRSAHHTLHQLREQCIHNRVRWILDADISGCFDNIDHDLLLDFLGYMVKDKNILRLIGKWLNSGVLEELVFTNPEIDRHSARFGYQPDAGQCVFALCAGRLVRP